MYMFICIYAHKVTIKSYKTSIKSPSKISCIPKPFDLGVFAKSIIIFSSDLGPRVITKQLSVVAQSSWGPVTPFAAAKAKSSFFLPGDI